MVHRILDVHGSCQRPVSRGDSLWQIHAWEQSLSREAMRLKAQRSLPGFFCTLLRAPKAQPPPVPVGFCGVLGRLCRFNVHLFQDIFRKHVKSGSSRTCQCEFHVGRTARDVLCKSTFGLAVGSP